MAMKGMEEDKGATGRKDWMPPKMRSNTRPPKRVPKQPGAGLASDMSKDTSPDDVHAKMKKGLYGK